MTRGAHARRTRRRSCSADARSRTASSDARATASRTALRRVRLPAGRPGRAPPPQGAEDDRRDARDAQGGLRVRADRSREPGLARGADRLDRRRPRRRHSSAPALLDGIVAEGGAGGRRGRRDDRSTRRSRATSFRTSLRRRAIATLLARAAGSRRRRAATPAHILFTSGSTGCRRASLITHDNVARLPRLGDPALRDRARRPALVAPAAPLRPLDLRRLRRAHRRRRAAPRRPGAQPQPARPRALHRRGGADAVVLGAVDDDVPRLGRRRPGRRLADAAPRALLRRGAADARARATGCDGSPTPLHEPLRADRGDDREQLPHVRRAVPPTTREPIPIGSACDGEELLVLDETLAPVATGETATSIIAGVGLSPGYWRDEEKTNAAFVRDPRPNRAARSTGPATSPGSATTASRTSSAGWTPRSRAAATGSSSARSRPR